MFAWIASLVLVVLTSGAAVAGDTEMLAKGKEAADVLNRALRERLEAAVNGADPSLAFSVCSYQAQALTSEIEQRMGVRIKRTSMKLRNPKNAPDSFERSVLDRFESHARAGAPVDDVLEQGVVDGKTEYRYAQPIYVRSFCVTCHAAAGEMSPEVRKTLEERYPEDRATGYKTGDLRGIVSVVIPSE